MAGTYGDLLLRQDYGAVLAPDANRHDIRGCNGLEGILCDQAQPSASAQPCIIIATLFPSQDLAFGISAVAVLRPLMCHTRTYRLETIFPARRRW